MTVVGNLICQVGQWGFERWLLFFDEAATDVSQFIGFFS